MHFAGTNTSASVYEQSTGVELNAQLQIIHKNSITLYVIIATMENGKGQASEHESKWCRI